MRQSDLDDFRVSAGFCDTCGYSLADLRGEPVGSLGADAGMEQQFRHILDLLRNWKYNEAEIDSPRHSFQVWPQMDALFDVKARTGFLSACKDSKVCLEPCMHPGTLQD